MKELYRLFADDYKEEGFEAKHFILATAATAAFLLITGIAELLG